MKSEIKDALERLQFDTSQVLNYLQNIIHEEVSIDHSKTFIVDYSQYNFLKDNPQIKKQIENDSYLAFKARIRDDFVEFCRCISLQLEILTDYFCKLDSNTNETLLYPKQRIKPFLERVCNNELDDESRNTIYCILDLRNIASHRDTSNLPIEEQIAKRNNAVHLYINNLKQEEEKRMADSLKETIKHNSDWVVKVTYKKNGINSFGYAYVDILNIDNNLSANEVKEKAKNNLVNVNARFSDQQDIKVEFNRKGASSNQLNSFFKESDYIKTQKILLTLFDYFDHFIAQCY
jgi:hypothetical protein